MVLKKINNMNGNLGLKYNRLYWEKGFNIDEGEFSQYEDVENCFYSSTEHYFELETVYPGLLTGIGWIHERGEKEDTGLKLGFYFDYTTGMPAIPGSSIKGCIRSVFPQYDQEDNEDSVKTKQLREEKENYVISLLEKLKIENTGFSIKDLENEIFRGMNTNEEPLGIYKRDIFYDAFILGRKGKFLGIDTLAPHATLSEDYSKSLLKNPNPVSFLKILPGIKFRFNFDLKDGLIQADKKLELFKYILLERGIGAKTNVGYGCLKAC